MVTIASLWLPILLSAVFVWVASALVWMALPHHKSDFKKLSDDTALQDALRAQNVEPGMYWAPWAQGGADMKNPEVRAKFEKGPVAIVTVWPTGVPNMGKSMVLSLLFYIVVGACVAYVAGRTLSAGSEYLSVFRLTGTVSFMAYGLAYIPNAIWFGTPWPFTWKNVADAFLYGLLTAGVFGWLWPA